MDLMLFEALHSLLYGLPHPPGPLSHPGAEPTDVDMWITRQTYEFVASRSRCDECGAAFGRKVRLVTVHDLCDRSPMWQIAVDVRCRGWRRHRYAALVTESCGELRFGEVQPGRSRHME